MNDTPKSVETTNLLLFDGDCGFCTSSVAWLSRILPAAPQSVPYQRVNLDDYGMSLDEASDRVWLITPTRHHGGHLAVSALLRRQPSAAWRFVGWLLITPPFSLIAAAGYALVSRYRHHLPGGTPACRLEPPR